MAEFFSMGGYGFYVWTSWAVTFGLMAILIVVNIFKRRTIMRQLSQRLARQQVRQGNS